MFLFFQMFVPMASTMLKELSLKILEEQLTMVQAAGHHLAIII